MISEFWVKNWSSFSDVSNPINIGKPLKKEKNDYLSQITGLKHVIEQFSSLYFTLCSCVVVYLFLNGIYFYITEYRLLIFFRI